MAQLKLSKWPECCMDCGSEGGEAHLRAAPAPRSGALAHTVSAGGLLLRVPGNGEPIWENGPQVVFSSTKASHTQDKRFFYISNIKYLTGCKTRRKHLETSSIYNHFSLV